MHQILLLIIFIHLGSAIQVKLVVPKDVHPGSTVTLVCQYNLEGHRLYAVKWYRGNHEFFRYIPGDKPPMKSFGVNGIHVDHPGSSAHQVTLLNVPKHIGGNISCEVSTDGNFATAVDSTHLIIISDIKRPVLLLRSNMLQPDVPLQINCSAQPTTPLPAISFFLDDEKVDSRFVQDLGPGLASLTLPKMETKALPESYFPIRVRCEAVVKGHYVLSSSSIPIIPQLLLDLPASAASFGPLLCLHSIFVIIRCLFL